MSNTPSAALSRRRTEKAALWGIITLLGAPFGFTPAFAASLARQQNKNFSRSRDARQVAANGKFTACDENSALARFCRDIGAKGGVTIQGVFIHPGKDVRNAMMLAYRSDEAFLYFFGDPEEKGFLIEGSKENDILRGIVAHEVGHAQTPGSILYRFQVFTTTSLYLAGGFLVGAMGTAGLMLGASILSGIGWIGAGIAGVATGIALPALSQRFSRNEEYLADLRAAKLTGPGPVIDCLSYMQAHERVDDMKEKAQQEQNPKPNSVLQKIGRLSDRFYGAQHPDTQTRITTLRTAFNHHAAAQDEKPSGLVPPAP